MQYKASIAKKVEVSALTAYSTNWRVATSRSSDSEMSPLPINSRKDKAFGPLSLMDDRREPVASMVYPCTNNGLFGAARSVERLPIRQDNIVAPLALPGS